MRFGWIAFILLAVAYSASAEVSRRGAVTLRAPAGSWFENRCGWFSNPTPGNAWLDDKDGQWIIGEQGGRQAKGDWPEFKPAQWVRTNGNYGYGCACLRMKADPKTFYVSEIKSVNAQALTFCRRDRELKEPKE